MNKSRYVTRRHALQLEATAAALPLVHIRTAGAAGKLTVGFWDRCVPPANEAMKAQGKAVAQNAVEDARTAYHTPSLRYALALGACPIAFSIGDVAAAEQYVSTVVDQSAQALLAVIG
jgi:hypothetical protein